jgi:hypothetical protein
MTRTITITKGNQYNPAGYYLGVTESGLYAWGEIGPRMDGTVGVTRDGNYVPRAEDKAAVDEAIKAVLADGQTRTLRLGKADPVVPATPEPEWVSPRGLTLAQEMDRDDTVY